MSVLGFRGLGLGLSDLGLGIWGQGSVFRIQVLGCSIYRVEGVYVHM